MSVAEPLPAVQPAIERPGEIRDSRVFELGSTMTLILLLFYGGSHWYLEIPVVILCSLGLLHRPLIRESNFWFLTTVFLASSNFQNWYSIDNHKYLITYWCLALWLAVSAANPRESLKVNARLLIGLAFLFATVWKIMSPDFLSHEFFYHTLLTEPRFATLAKVFGGATDQVLAQSARVTSDLESFDSTLASVPLAESARLLALAKLLTWWTLLIEGAIALAFCWPEGRWSSRLGDGLLLVFLLTTYMSATVVGFGWILSIMGLVSSPHRYARGLYVLAFLIIFLYSGPWSSFFGALGEKLLSFL